MADSLTPAVQRARLFNAGSINSGINWLTNDITPVPLDGGQATFNTSSNKRSTVLRITVNAVASGVLSIKITNNATAVTGTLNSGIALVAGATYSFQHEVVFGDTVNFTYSVNSAVNWFYVSEVISENF